MTIKQQCAINRSKAIKQLAIKAAEYKGRLLMDSLLKDLGATNITYTDEISNPVDCYFTINGKHIVCEIKNRDIKYIDATSHYIELNKYMNLTYAKVMDKCYAAIYANFFGDTCYIYNINNIPTEKITLNKLVKHSVYGKAKVDKPIINIPTRNATVYQRIDGVWVQTKPANKRLLYEYN